jgi:hypothetical protein
MRSLDQIWQLVARLWPGEKGRILREIGTQAQRLRADLVERGGEIVGVDVTGYPGPNLNAVLEAIAAGAPGGSPDALAVVVVNDLGGGLLTLGAADNHKLIYLRDADAGWAAIDWEGIEGAGLGGATAWRVWLTNATGAPLPVAPVRSGLGDVIPILAPSGRIAAGVPPDVVDVSNRDILTLEVGETAMLVYCSEATDVTPAGAIVAGVYRVSAGGGGGPVAWGDVTGKPSTFPPDSHNHPATAISDSTTTGRALITAADAAAGRTALALGAAATRAIGTSAGQIRDAADAAYTDARTPTAHTHPLADLTQSGATSGQVPQWNGSAWVPQTPSGGSPAGSGTEVQYRDGSSFGAMAGTAWDNANRALTITGATVTTSQPILNLSQTWNAGAVAFRGIEYAATVTAASADSTLLRTLRGANAKFQVDMGSANAVGLRVGETAGNLFLASLSNGSIFLGQNAGSQMWFSILGANTVALGNAADARINRDAANRIGFRNGANANAIGVYNTESGSLANFERLNVEWAGNIAYIEPSAAGTGTLRTLIVRHPPVALSALPTAAAAGAGARAVINDSTVAMSGNFGAIVTGGGSNLVPLISDGTDWRIG